MVPENCRKHLDLQAINTCD